MSLIRRLALVLFTTFAVLSLGLGSAFMVLRFNSGVANGPWRTNLLSGSVDADIYTRARVAVGGLLALSPAETIYFLAEVDDSGAALDARFDYRVEGVELPARWWSVTAYAADMFLIPNEAGRYSFSKTTLDRDPAGPWVIRVSKDPKPGNWLPVASAGGNEHFSLTIRLYNPDPAVAKAPQTIVLPKIVREDQS